MKFLWIIAGYFLFEHWQSTSAVQAIQVRGPGSIANPSQGSGNFGPPPTMFGGPGVTPRPSHGTGNFVSPPTMFGGRGVTPMYPTVPVSAGARIDPVMNLPVRPPVSSAGYGSGASHLMRQQGSPVVPFSAGNRLPGRMVYLGNQWNAEPV